MKNKHASNCPSFQLDQIFRGTRHAWLHAGFTLVEMLVTVAILAILLSVAAPPLNNLVQGKQLLGQATKLATAINFARSEAISRAVNVVICASTDGASCSDEWEDGWIVFVDDDENSVRGGQELLIKKEGPVFGNVILDTDNNVTSLTFNFEGASNATTFNLCAQDVDAQALEQNRSRRIVINRVGSISIQSGVTDCNG